MMGRSHIAIGLAASVLLKDVFVPHTIGGLTIDSRLVFLGGMAAAVIGSILPDIDHSNSAVAHKVGIARGRGCLTDGIFGMVRQLAGGHRALTHSLWAVLALAFVFGLQVGSVRVGEWVLPLGWPGLTAWGDIGTAFVLAYALHVAADLLTKEGVKLFYPASRNDVGLGPKKIRFATGGLVEYAVVVFIGSVAVWRWFA